MSDNKNVKENSENKRTIKISLVGIIVVFLVLIVGIGCVLFTVSKKKSANTKIGTLNIMYPYIWKI